MEKNLSISCKDIIDQIRVRSISLKGLVIFEDINMLFLFNKTISFLCGLIFLFNNSAYAQLNNFTFKNPSHPANTNMSTPHTPPTNQVIAPNDFQNMVNKLGKQNLNNLSQQVNQQSAKSMPPASNASLPPLSSANKGVVSAPPASPPITHSTDAAKPGQNQVYTGFNFGNTNSNTGVNTNPSNKNSTGWNIKY
jgi:hypothetical protein